MTGLKRDNRLYQHRIHPSTYGTTMSHPSQMAVFKKIGASITFSFIFILFFLLRQFPLISEQFRQFPAIGSSFPISTASSPIQRNILQLFYPEQYLKNIYETYLHISRSTRFAVFSQHSSFDEYPWHLQYPLPCATILMLLEF